MLVVRAVAASILVGGALAAADAFHDDGRAAHDAVLSARGAGRAASAMVAATTFPPATTTTPAPTTTTVARPRPTTTTTRPAAPRQTSAPRPATSAPPTTMAPALAPAPAPPTRAAQVAADLFVRMNAERAARGVAPLHWDGGLASSATSWSAHLEAIGSLVHSNVNLLLGSRFDEVAENIGYVSGAGATSGAMHVDFMQSAHHRDAMLSGALDVVGIGVTCAPDGTMWVTEQFGRWTTTGPYVPIASTPAAPIARPDAGSQSC